MRPCSVENSARHRSLGGEQQRRQRHTVNSHNTRIPTIPRWRHLLPLAWKPDGVWVLKKTQKGQRKPVSMKIHGGVQERFWFVVWILTFAERASRDGSFEKTRDTKRDTNSSSQDFLHLWARESIGAASEPADQRLNPFFGWGEKKTALSFYVIKVLHECLVCSSKSGLNI